jgi:excinuclease ABC subunit C
MEGVDLGARVRELPHQPGVYLFRDRFGRVIYVGKARDLRKRVSQYFQASRRFEWDRKTRALVGSIREIEHHAVRSEPEAILLEGRLIKEYRPRYNVSFRDDKRFLLLRVHLDDPWPRFQLTRLRRDDGARYFGPYAHSGALRTTLEHLQRIHGLRACRPVLPGERDFKHCHDDIIRNCSAPCMGRITRAEYLSRVREACAFLEGKSGPVRESLEEEMRAAAARQDYERAAGLRDLLEDLETTARPSRRFVRSLPETAGPGEQMAELQRELGLASLPRHIECFDISNISATHKVASMVVFREGRVSRYHHRRYRVKTVEGQDDFASMAEVVRRRYGRVLREGGRMPDLVVVDGGRGQLGMAVRELEALGCGGQAVVGLAKEHEEIYRPGAGEPLRLPRTSGALRLLQRVRDEAHRVANGYHQLLMKRRMSESRLDAVPGISRAKKQALLRHFGTVEGVARADEAALREVTGIGPKLAGVLVGYFAGRARAGQREGEGAGGADTVYKLRDVSRVGDP